MTYTESDVLQAIAIALEWGQDGIGISAQEVVGGESPILSPGMGAIIEASPEAVALLAKVQDALDAKPEGFCSHTSGRGISRYDYREV